MHYNMARQNTLSPITLHLIMRFHLTDLLLQLVDPSFIYPNELVEFLTALTDTIYCLLHFHYFAVSLALLLFVEFKELFYLAVVIHV